MKRSAFLVSMGLLLLPFAQAGADAEKGKAYFNDVQGGNCRTCHYTDETKLVGPGLGNLLVRHSEEWVRLFITDPQKTWQTDHPETIELKKSVRGGFKKRYTGCKKRPMAAETKQDLIDFFKTLSIDATQ